MYTFKIIKNENGFRVQFLYRKEVMFWTESYKSKASAKKAIESLIAKAATAAITEEDQTKKTEPATATKPAAKQTVKKSK
jgi:uncharacterized protein YegP (UPF0339 family)